MFLQRLCTSRNKVGNIPRFTMAVFSRPAHTNVKKSQSEAEEDEDEKPIKYSTSPASRWKAGDFGKNNAPWIQDHIVVISTISFMIYFFILREENDLDDIIYRPLNETIPDIDKLMPGYHDSKPEYVKHWEEYNKARNTNRVNIENIQQIKTAAS